MSLAQLFYLKNPRPAFRRLFRRRRRICDASHRILFEPLEPRLLMTAAPAVVQQVVLDQQAPPSPTVDMSSPAPSTAGEGSVTAQPTPATEVATVPDATSPVTATAVGDAASATDATTLSPSSLEATTAATVPSTDASAGAQATALPATDIIVQQNDAASASDAAQTGSTVTTPTALTSPTPSLAYDQIFTDALSAVGQAN